MQRTLYTIFGLVLFVILAVFCCSMYTGERLGDLIHSAANAAGFWLPGIFLSDLLWDNLYTGLVYLHGYLNDRPVSAYTIAVTTSLQKRLLFTIAACTVFLLLLSWIAWFFMQAVWRTARTLKAGYALAGRSLLNIAALVSCVTFVMLIVLILSVLTPLPWLTFPAALLAVMLLSAGVIYRLMLRHTTPF